MKVITILPGGSPEKREMICGLEELQRFVGGNIEIVPIDDTGLLAVINEEGKLIDLRATALSPYLHDILCGPVVIVRADWGGDLLSVRDSDLPRVRRILLPCFSREVRF